MNIQRTSFTLAALTGLSHAIRATAEWDSLTHSIDTHYQSQDQCDALTDDWKYHYEFDQDSCRCFFTFDIHYDPGCHGETPLFNPLHVPGHHGDLCISQVELDDILANTLGMDCLPGTEDDPH